MDIRGQHGRTLQEHWADGPRTTLGVQFSGFPNLWAIMGPHNPAVFCNIPRCVETNDVFYFGEDVDIFEDGLVVRHDGSWEAGKSGAQPGIVIPARFLLGSRYFQEQALPVAADRSEHVGMRLDVTAAGRTFHHCVSVTETSPLEPGQEESKVYCPGVGLVKDDTLTLSDFDRP